MERNKWLLWLTALSKDDHELEDLERKTQVLQEWTRLIVASEVLAKVASFTIKKGNWEGRERSCTVTFNLTGEREERLANEDSATQVRKRV